MTGKMLSLLHSSYKILPKKPVSSLPIKSDLFRDSPNRALQFLSLKQRKRNRSRFFPLKNHRNQINDQCHGKTKNRSCPTQTFTYFRPTPSPAHFIHSIKYHIFPFFPNFLSFAFTFAGILHQLRLIYIERNESRNFCSIVRIINNIHLYFQW